MILAPSKLVKSHDILKCLLPLSVVLYQPLNATVARAEKVTVDVAVIMRKEKSK